MDAFRRLLSELRRRRVFRVAAVYAVVGWIVTEIASVVVPALLLPEWLVRAVVVLVLLGFPIAVVLAWAYDVTPDGVRRTGPVETAAPDQVESTPVPARSRFWPAVSALLAVLLVVVVVFALRARFQDSAERRARALLPTIAELAEEGRYSEAFRLAGDASRSLEGDTALARMWPRVADHLTVRTDPPGATVAARLFNGGVEAGDEEFEVLGTTPLELHRIPRTPHLLRIERTGFAPVERLVSSALLRTEAQTQSAPAIEVDVVLVPEAEAPDDMVLVPGGMYELVTPDLPEDRRAMLDDYFIDRYEVSNAGFREFVAGGGYATRTLWPAPIVTEGDTLDFEATMDRLVDRTGLPGPRGWTGREYPEGRGNHPVSGITWYEAAAYCAFRGKRLPTIFQWEKAARDGRITHYEGVVMPWGLASFGASPRARANFGSTGTVPVDAHPFGISPYGAYAMAGNVKEWVANPFSAGRGATGGSWEDPMYLFSEVGALDPFFASESLGFRCARVRADDARRHRDQGGDTIELDQRTPEYEPVDEPTFRSLLAHYRYDALSPAPEVLETVETPDWMRERLSYAGPEGERVLAYLWTPKSVSPPYQTIVYVPGSDVFFDVSVPESTERWVGPVIRSGRAAFAVVMKGMAEREWEVGYRWPEPPTVGFRDLMVRHATELRLGLDYLETREEIDMDRLAYVGLSWGAGSRLGFAAVDDRYDAVVFIGGGIDERVKPTLPEADNVNFAPYIEPPKLLLNGRHDEEHPWFTRALPLWELLREPKELALVDGAGHVPPADVRIPAINGFLDRVLGAVP